jgi:AraC family transcriptional regulator of adaptative response / DNA-3-methyladenine glycosylase II
LLDFFAVRATPGVELVTSDRYVRTVRTGSGHGIIDARDVGGTLSLTVHGIGTENLFAAVQRARGLFDLDAPIDDIALVLSHDRTLRAWLKGSPGVRVPGAWDGFELTVRAVLGQQVSVKAATTVAGRIADRYGEPPVDVAVDDLPDAPGKLFPEPEVLARARLERLGIIRSRAQTIRSVARAVASGELSFDTAQSRGSATGRPPMLRCACSRTPMHFRRRTLGCCARSMTQTADACVPWNWRRALKHGARGGRMRRY